MHYFFVLLLLITSAACSTTRSAPAAAVEASAPAGPEAFSLAVLGDFGVNDINEAQVAALIHSWKPDYIVTVGDDNYEHGAADTIDANIGQYYHDYIRFDSTYQGAYASQASKEQRFFATLGNHDWHTPGAAPYLAYFDLPGNERYYQVRRGAVEFFAIDSDEHEPDGVDVGSKQALWLKNALAQSTAPWKIVAFHHPPYSTGEHGNNVWMQWPFQEWGASLVFTGHDHHYERIVMHGFPYWIVGTGGAHIRPIERNPLAQADVDVTYDKKHGALLVQGDATQMSLRFYNVDNELIDSYRIERDASLAPAAH